MILADSSGTIAVLLKGDQWHQPAMSFVISNHDEIVLPSTTVAEVAYFLGERSAANVEAQFLRDVARGVHAILDPVSADYLRAADLVEQYADFPLGAVDALVVAIAERLNVTTIFTLDRRHFGAIRPLHCESFTRGP